MIEIHRFVSPLRHFTVIMSSGDPSARPSTQPKLEEAIQEACEDFEDIFKAEHDDDRIKKKLYFAWFIRVVHVAVFWRFFGVGFLDVFWMFFETG
jgi:hypothetical protein